MADVIEAARAAVLAQSGRPLAPGSVIIKLPVPKTGGSAPAIPPAPFPAAGSIAANPLLKLLQQQQLQTQQKQPELPAPPGLGALTAPLGIDISAYQTPVECSSSTSVPASAALSSSADSTDSTADVPMHKIPLTESKFPIASKLSCIVPIPQQTKKVCNFPWMLNDV